MPRFPAVQPALALIATLMLSLPAAARQADVRLPSLGSSADTVISPQEAREYGAEFLRQLRAAHVVLDDPLVDQYLQTLGYRLISASDTPSQPYNFVALNIPQINAFATFGGYVFIFSGMFTATRNQDELAAVMAHEMAHVSQHHLQRAIEDQRKTAPLYLIGALGAALAASQVNSGSPRVVTNPYGYGYGSYGSYGSSSADAAAAAFYSVMALMQQHRIDFTRKDEEEADHVGIGTLASASFDPEAMADFFAHMQALIRPGGSGGMAAGSLPDFLQDHPVTSVRIADARARAHVMEQAPDTPNGGHYDPLAPGLLPLPFVDGDTRLLDGQAQGPSELQYELIRERVRVLSSNNPHATLNYYSRNMGGNETFAHSISNRYGHALALVLAGDAGKAVPMLRELVSARPDDLILALGLADAERHAGQRDKALQRYAALNEAMPNEPAIVLDYARALLDDGTAASARIAQNLLKPLLNDESEPSLYEAYGHACHVAGDDVHAGLAYADATFLSGNAEAALDQLHRLLDREDLDYYSRAQINARIAQVTPIVLEIKRRHLDRDDPGRDDNQLRGPDTGLSFHACAGTTCGLH